MKTLKRLGLLTMFMALAVMTVSGCSSSSSDSSSGSSSSDSSTTTVSWSGTDYTSATTVSAPDSNFTDKTSSYPMASYCSISDSALLFDDTAADASAQPMWRYNSGSSGVFGTKSTMTIIFKAKVTSSSNPGITIDLYMGGFRSKLTLYTSKLAMTSTSDTTVDASTYHTYMLSYTVTSSGITANLYVDGASSALMTETNTTSQTNYYLQMGDGSSSSGYSGSIAWFYYTFDGAFIPSNVTLPDGISL